AWSPKKKIWGNMVSNGSFQPCRSVSGRKGMPCAWVWSSPLQCPSSCSTAPVKSGSGRLLPLVAKAPVKKAMLSEVGLPAGVGAADRGRRGPIREEGGAGEADDVGAAAEEVLEDRAVGVEDDDVLPPRGDVAAVGAEIGAVVGDVDVHRQLAGPLVADRR